MRMTWIVCWRGLEETWASRQDALDRWDRLDAFGIEAQIFAVVGTHRTRLPVAG